MFTIVQDYERVIWLLFSLYLISGAVMDLREKSVPRWWLAAGSGLTAVLIIYPVLAVGVISDAQESALTPLLRAAGAGVGLLFLGVAWMKPNSFGTADGFLIVMIGALTGLWHMMDVLMIAFLLATVYGAVRYMATRSRKVMAFIPFLAAGFIAGGVIGL